MSLKKASLIILSILLVDQLSKIYIKTNFELYETVEVFSWFRILFIENEGAAWGTKLSDFIPFISDKTGKLILTLFRLVAITGIGYWLYDSIKKRHPKVLILAISLIFAGAFGNIIDSLFYGMIFNDSHGQVATLFSSEPYGTLFHGKVVDMFQLPFIKDKILPEWVPFYGGRSFTFFEPIFNVADTSISTGVGILLVFNKKAFPKKSTQTED